MKVESESEDDDMGFGLFDQTSSLFYLYVYTVSTINDMANFCICICVTDFVYFQMLYNHCGYTIPGVMTGNG